MPNRVSTLFLANHPPALYLTIPLKIQVFNLTSPGQGVISQKHSNFQIRNFISETSKMFSQKPGDVQKPLLKLLHFCLGPKFFFSLAFLLQYYLSSVPTMELSERLVQVKSTAKEEELPEYTPDDIIFLFGDVIRPVRLILNYNDPTEYHVLCPPVAPMSDILKLTENPSWVGTHMKLGLHKPQTSILRNANKLLQDKALEEGEEYEYIPIKPLNPTGSGVHSTPKKEEILLLQMPWQIS